MYLKRRELLKGTIASLLYSIVPARASAEQAATLPKRVLGRTGLEVAALGYGACEQYGLTGNSATDNAAVPAGDGYFYLVTAENRLDEEGTKGFDSAQVERTNDAPCP